MEKVNRIFKVRVEELPLMAESLKNAFLRDQAQFLQYSPDFNADYLARYEQVLLGVESAVYPGQLTADAKVLTQRYHGNLNKLRVVVNRLEGYVNRAESLSVPPKEFRFSGVRKHVDGAYAEGILAELKILLQRVDENLPALQARGLTAEARTELGQLLTAIKADNVARNQLLSQRELLVQENTHLCNDLWHLMGDIADTGKRIFRSTDPARTKDYTLSQLRTRVHREREEKTTPAPAM